MTIIETEKGRRMDKAGSDAWVLAAFDEHRSLYVVVGLGGSGGWNGSGQKMRSKAEIKQRQERKKQREANKAAKQAEKIKQREERRRLRRERNAANGLFESDDDASESEADTESESSSGSNSSTSDSESDDDGRGKRRKRSAHNRFGLAFQETVQETGARVRLDLAGRGRGPRALDTGQPLGHRPPDGRPHLIREKNRGRSLDVLRQCDLQNLCQMTEVISL